MVFRLRSTPLPLTRSLHQFLADADSVAFHAVNYHHHQPPTGGLVLSPLSSFSLTTINPQPLRPMSTDTLINALLSRPEKYDATFSPAPPVIFAPRSPAALEAIVAQAFLPATCEPPQAALPVTSTPRSPAAAEAFVAQAFLPAFCEPPQAALSVAFAPQAFLHATRSLALPVASHRAGRPAIISVTPPERLSKSRQECLRYSRHAAPTFASSRLRVSIAAPAHRLAPLPTFRLVFLFALFLCAVSVFSALSVVNSQSPSAFSALATAIFPTARASCGFSWNYTPSSPFMNSSGDYRFQYVEHLADADISRSAKPSDPKIPLNLIFTPVRGAYPGGRLLGQGWWFPAIESTCLQISERHFEMCLPNGEKVTLEHLGNGNIKGGTWSGSKRYDDITLTSSCKWQLKFSYGRLILMVSPTGERYEFDIARSTGTRSVTYAGSPVLTVKRHFNEKTLFSDYTVTYTAAGKQQTIELQMGERPVMTTFTYTDENGREQTQSRQKQTDTLRSIKRADGSTKNLSFTTTSLTAAGIPFRWNIKNNVCTEGDWKKFSFVKIHGVDCLQTKFSDGTSTFFGQNAQGISVQQERDGFTRITESVKVNDGNFMLPKPRRVWHYKNGYEELVEQHWYDENGEEVRTMIRENGRNILYEHGKNYVLSKDKDTGKTLIEKRYDAQKRLVYFQNGGTIYSFAYNNANITLVKKIGEKEIRKIVPYETVAKILRRL